MILEGSLDSQNFIVNERNYVVTRTQRIGHRRKGRGGNLKKIIVRNNAALGYYVIV
jgi:hypothetical protein